MNTNAHNFPKIYDEISGNYRQSESISQRKNVIKDRFKHFLETEKPKSLLDLGCGAGVFAIIAKQAGVKTVVGVDISSAQIRAAKIEAVLLGLDIEYFSQDISLLKIDRKFDAISSVFGFCYASSRNMLRKQLVAVHTHLKTGGAVFAVVSHPQHPTRDWGNNYRVCRQEKLKDGVKLKCDFLVDDKIVATDYKFYWTAQTWRNILEDTGFSDITWEELDEHSTNIIFIAKKT